MLNEPQNTINKPRSLWGFLHHIFTQHLHWVIFIMLVILSIVFYFSLNVTAVNTYTKKIDLSTAIGSSPSGSLTQGTDGMFYGMTGSGGPDGGVLFQSRLKLRSH